MKFTTAIGLLLLTKYSLQQNFTLSLPATGPSITCQGSDVTLQCLILRNGIAVDPDWRRNGIIVDTNVLTNHSFVFNSTTNVNDLVITDVGLEDDNTEYDCTVENSNITTSIVLNVIGPPSVEIMSITNSTCSTSVKWSSSRSDICGPITYDVHVQLPNSDSVSRNLTTNLDILMTDLVPNTNYTITIAAMDSTGIGVTQEGKFDTAIIPPAGEIFTATWRCDDRDVCGICANWTTITEANESCSPIIKLELQNLNASNDNVTVNNGVTTAKLYTALIPVYELITRVVLIATYDGGIIRSSGLIDYIAGSNFLLHGLEGKLLFIDEQIIVNATWRGATNLGITYRVFLECNNSYTEEDIVIKPLTTNFTMPQNETVDNIECEVTISIDDIQTINLSLNGTRMSTSSPSTTDSYCEDNPGVCIGIPVVVATAILIVLAVVVLLLAHSNSRRILLSLFHQNSKTSVVSKTQATENEYVTVTEDANTNVQPSGESDAISLQNTESAVAAVNEKPKYAEVTLPDNLPIHIPPNNIVSYAQIQH